MKILAYESDTETTGVGELCVKRPSLFKEYWKLPEVLSGLIIVLSPSMNFLIV